MYVPEVHNEEHINDADDGDDEVELISSVYCLVMYTITTISLWSTLHSSLPYYNLLKTILNFQEFDDKTDEMADKAVDAVKKSVSSIWKYASGYATQMFTEEDLESEAIMVMGDDKNPVLLDRLQEWVH